MTLIFTKSNKPLSLLIRYGLSEPVSHFGIVFDNGIVFHSNLLGTHVEWYKTFAKHCDVVYSIEAPMQLIEEEKVYRDILDTYDGMGYDYKAFLYFLYRATIKRLFGVPLPKTNKFEDTDKFLCTELAECLPKDLVPKNIEVKDLGIVSPYQLYLGMKKE